MKRGLRLALLLCILGFAAAALAMWPLEPPPLRTDNLVGDPDRGAYLARMGGCIGCHTKTDESGPVLAGGASLETPFGSFVPPNITPDRAHGIGGWTLEDFIAAVRHGISPDGQPYYPAFPYAFYTRLSEQDVADIWAAIWTVPPVGESANDHALAFPFDQRAGLKLWRTLYFDASDYQPVDSKSDAWNRGRFIVTGPAHCGACHTPRNLLGARDHDRRFFGAHDLPGGHEAPSIRPLDLKDKGWSEVDITFALRTGIGLDGDSLGGSMGEVIRDGTSWLSDEDLRAVATYLLDNAPESTP